MTETTVYDTIMGGDRPCAYKYAEALSTHLGTDGLFGTALVYPRQLEFALPGDGKRLCNYNCPHCQGIKLRKESQPYEGTALELIRNLAGVIPYHIYCGTYGEPTMNSRLEQFIGATKMYGSNFGLHTNGSRLSELQTKNDFVTMLCAAATEGDYVSISVDAGTPETHQRVKGLRVDGFSAVLSGITNLVAAKNRINTEYPTVRLTYVMTEDNANKVDVEAAVGLAKSFGVDSLRFSVAYAPWGTDWGIVQDSQEVEGGFGVFCRNLVAPYLSLYQADRPFTFFLEPESQAVTDTGFTHCVAGYYQLMVGSDGFFYRCNSVASSTFKHLRLGEITSDISKFNTIVRANQSGIFNPQESCFSRQPCARCCRATLEMNRRWGLPCSL